MKNKTIVIVGPAHPLRGGLATFNERLAREFQKENIVSILTFNLQYPGFLFPGQSQYSGDPKPNDLVIEVKLNSINPFNWIKMGLKYKKLKPDLIVYRYWMPFFGPCFGLFARLVKQNGHTKQVAITDNVIPHEKRFFDKAFTKYFFKPLDGFVAQSESVLKDIDLFDTQKPKLYNPHPLYDNFGEGISKEEACKKLGLDSAVTYLLFFGFIRHYKGLDLLLDSIADQRFAGRNLKLIIAGEFYEDRNKYDEQIEKLDIEDRLIRRHEFIPNDLVSAYFSAADLIVQTYHSATQSGVTQVAYHFNKPVLVTDVGGMREYVTNNETGYLVKPDKKDVADKIEEFLKEDKNQFNTGIEEAKKRFSWKNLVESISKVAFGQ